MKENNLYTIEVSYIKGHKTLKGILKLDKNYLSFTPLNGNHDTFKEAVYRIVQTGFSKILQFIPYKFYIKTMSGRVVYFKTLKAKEIVKTIEKLIY